MEVQCWVILSALSPHAVLSRQVSCSMSLYKFKQSQSITTEPWFFSRCDHQSVKNLSVTDHRDDRNILSAEYYQSPLAQHTNPLTDPGVHRFDFTLMWDLKVSLTFQVGLM